MNNIYIDIHIDEFAEINSRVSSVDKFGVPLYFATLHLYKASIFFEDVETIDKVIKELKKARKGLEKAKNEIK